MHQGVDDTFPNELVKVLGGIFPVRVSPVDGIRQLVLEPLDRLLRHENHWPVEVTNFLRPVGVVDRPQQASLRHDIPRALAKKQYAEPGRNNLRSLCLQQALLN